MNISRVDSGQMTRTAVIRGPHYFVPRTQTSNAWYEYVAGRYFDVLESVQLAAERKSRQLVLGVATGGTMEGFYEALLRNPKACSILRGAKLVGLDEYEGLNEGHGQTYRVYYRQRLLGPLGLGDESLLLPGQDNVDDFDNLLQSMGGTDLQLLGLGANGHIGFNEPGTLRNSPTRRVALAARTRQDNARFFGGNLNDVPTHAFTMGIDSIVKARWNFLLATGDQKADAVRKMIFGPATETCPASLLWGHDKTYCFLDAPAATGLVCL